MVFFKFLSFFFCRLGLKCFIYREMVNYKGSQIVRNFPDYRVVEPIKFVLRSVIYISVTVSDM